MPGSIIQATNTLLDKLIPSATLRRHPISTLSATAASLTLVITWLFYVFPGSSALFRPLLAGIVPSNTSLIVLEPENGTLTSPMTTGTDTAASGNKYVFTTITNTTQANTSALASSNSSRVLATVAAPTGGGINVEPSMRPWRYVGANPDSWWCVPPNCSQNPDPTVSINAELSLSHQLGVRLLRLEFPWFLIEPQKGTFDWTRSDYIVNTAKQMGVEIEPILVFSPSWAATGPNNGPKSTDYASFTTAIVNRYKSSIHVWELWNEPNLGQYCSCNYMSSILIPGSNAVRAADPTALVAIGAPAGADTNWISGIYNNGGAQYFDIMGFHDYVGGGQVLSDANLVYNVMSAHGDANKPLWLGEYGFQESGVQDNQQQGLMTVVLNAIKNKTTHITMAEWYNLRDDDPMDCCPPSVIKHETYGIVLHDDTTKKIGFTTMQNLLASFGGTTPPPPPSPNPPPPAPSPPPLPTNTGQAALTLNASSTGTYYVWTRMKAADANSDSYWLQVDNQAGIRVGDGGVPFGSWTWVNWQNGTTSSKVSVSLTQGSHTLKVIGREANTQIDTVVLSPDPVFDPNNPAIIDSLPPVVTINSPANSATLSGTSSVSVQATDDHSVGTVDLIIDNVLFASSTTPSGNIYSFPLDTTKFTSGTHSLFAKASDIAGNVGVSSTISFNVSQPTPPPPPPSPTPPPPSPTPPPPSPCPTQPVPVGGCPVQGDLNSDGKVNIFDFSILLRNWGALGGTADLNHDGIVNIIDLSILLRNWT